MMLHVSGHEKAADGVESKSVGDLFSTSETFPSFCHLVHDVQVFNSMYLGQVLSNELIILI